MLKGLLQVTFFFIWTVTLIYLILISTFTFVIFTVCLGIFLFWLVLTCTGWFITIIPIVKFAFLPWHRKQCRLWTKDNRQKQFSIGTLLPFSKTNETKISERILWFGLESILKNHQNNIQIVIYTGNMDMSIDDALQYVKHRCDIDLNMYKPSITLVYVRSQRLIDENYFKFFYLIGRGIATVIVGIEAFIRFIPDVYIDTNGSTLTYPLFYYLASIPVMSYVDYSTINNDLFDYVSEQCIKYNKSSKTVMYSSFVHKLKLISYQLYAYAYGWCGRCANIVSCNSLCTKKRIESVWGPCRTCLIYPPYDTKELLEMPLFDQDEQAMKSIVSTGEFRRETNHELQIEAFYQFLQRNPSYSGRIKLILIGRRKDQVDDVYLNEVRQLIDSLNINQDVVIKLNPEHEELKHDLHQATIGLLTSLDENSEELLDMMAAGTIVVTNHKLEDESTGFTASDVDSLVAAMGKILEMKSNERRQIQEQARTHVQRFSIEHFQRMFIGNFDKILFVK